MAKTTFIPGKTLSRRFYHEVVKGIIDDSFPGLTYSAGLLDYGSDVLGYDDEVSTDHQWGPRLSIFLAPQEIESVAPRLERVLSQALPPNFLGYSTNFSGTKADFIRHMETAKTTTVGHLIRIHSPDEFFLQHLGIDYGKGLTNQDWLSFPQQRLLTIRRGELFHDGLGLAELKRSLEFFPDSVWLYLMSVEWRKIGSEEAFMARCGDRGDELGSRLVAGRLVERLMRLHFLQNRQYFPYAKWFGTAFRELDGSKTLGAVLGKVLRSGHWKKREKWLCRAYGFLAARHNLLKLTAPIEASITLYYDRPYRVLFAARYADALLGCVDDATLVNAEGLGSIDQVIDNSALLENVVLIRSRIKLT